MFSKTERTLAFRYLKSRKRTGFVSVIAGFSFLGIMLGVATLIIVMSVMNGFKSELMGRILGLNGQIGVYPVWGDRLDGYQDKIAEVLTVDGVAYAVPVLDGQVMASAERGSAGVMTRGILADDFKKQTILFEGYTGDDLSGFKGNSIVVGYRLAAKLGVRVGDNLTLISPKGNITAFGTIPKMKTFFVLGTFNTGMFEYDSNFIFMPLDMAQAYLMATDKVSQIELFLTPNAQADKVLEAVFSKMESKAQVYDWRHSNQVFFNAIEVERNVMFLILTLIIVVAAFNMISGLIMMVRDKTKDIAVLRTMGMSRKSILSIFLMSGLTVGVVGTAAGVALGLLFSYNIDAIKVFLEGLSGQELFSAEIYFLSHLPAEVNLTEVVVVTGISLLLSLLATVYPAWKASKTDPVEALRYE